MQDRVSLYPGRVKLEPVAGQAKLYDLTRADQPTQEGTPLNKASLLSDATAAAIKALLASQTEDPATPNDALNILTQAVENVATVAAGKCSIETSTYTGTGSAGASSPTTLTFPKKPTAVIVFGEYSLLFITDKNTSTANVLCWLSDRTSWSRAKISWTGNKLKFYSENNGPAAQANMQNTVYQVIAFYAQDK